MEVVMVSREHLANAAADSDRLWEVSHMGPKARKLFGHWRTTSPFLEAEEKKNSLKMKERRGNVYENKGSDFETRERSRNVTENKGSYALKAGMLLKIKVVNR
jgi:hypothetical protein